MLLVHSTPTFVKYCYTLHWLHRAVNGLQNFEGFLEYFKLGSTLENATCTDTSHLTEGNRLILVRHQFSYHN